MNITNGSVTRSVKVADYETRTVALSFTVDDGEDADAAIKHVAGLAERHARRPWKLSDETAAVSIGSVPPITLKPPKAAEVAQPDPTPSSGDASSPPGSTVTELTPAVSDMPAAITDAVMDSVVKTARARNVMPEQIKAAILKYTKQPGVSMKTLGPQDRALLRIEIEALHPSAPVADAA